MSIKNFKNKIKCRVDGLIGHLVVGSCPVLFIAHTHTTTLCNHKLFHVSGGQTLLTEVAIKTAQFTDIVSLLLEAGADLGVRDNLGNTPLHNAVLYYPSTQPTVDLLLARGADVTVKNNNGDTPFHISDDKDLKHVLKELKKKKTQRLLSKRTRSKSKGYSDSPELRKLVCDPVLKIKDKKVKVTYNNPVKTTSPGLLKRKRKEESEESPSSKRKAKRIRFNETDSCGAHIDPEFSEDEDDKDGGNIGNIVSDILQNNVIKSVFKKKKKRI